MPFLHACSFQSWKWQKKKNWNEKHIKCPTYTLQAAPPPIVLVLDLVFVSESYFMCEYLI